MIFESLFLTSLLAGIGLALMVAPLSCVVVWQKMAYLGDTMAHAALPGIVFAVLFQVNITISVFITVCFVAVNLEIIKRYHSLSNDVILGILAHCALAIGIILWVFFEIKLDLHSLLFGDILAVTSRDIIFIYGAGILTGISVWFLWRSFLLMSLHPDFACAEGINLARTQMFFIILLALVIAIAMQLVGVLLTTTFLIIPAATARKFAQTPEQMVALAALFGVLAVFIGLLGSFTIDIPSGPTIILVGFILFMMSQIMVGAIGFMIKIIAIKKNTAKKK